MLLRVSGGRSKKFFLGEGTLAIVFDVGVAAVILVVLGVGRVSRVGLRLENAGATVLGARVPVSTIRGEDEDFVDENQRGTNRR